MKKAKSILALLLALLIAMGSTFCAFAADTREEDAENSTPETADLVGEGSPINGKISDVDDEDFFVFEAAKSGIAKVTLSHVALTGSAADASYFQVTITDSKGVNIESFKSTALQAEASAEFSVSPGDYYIKVAMDDINDANLVYTISVDIDTSADFEIETNNSVSDATAMGFATKTNPNKLYYGTISTNDVDYYKVTVTSSSLLYIGIYNTASKTGNYKATFIEVQPGVNSVPQELSLGSIKIGANEEQANSTAIGVDSGTYYLKVEGISGSVGGYQVRVYSGGSYVDIEHEYNNDVLNANTVRIGSKITGSLLDKDDVDCFKFSTAGNNYGYKVTVNAYDADAKKTEGQWMVEIVSASNGTVAKGDATNTKEAVISTETLVAGTYYIYVTDGNVFTDKIYELSFEALDPPADDGGDDDDGPLSFEEFAKQIADLNWGKLFDNFSSWLPSVNVFGMLFDMMKSIIPFITAFFFSNT
ncbi:MAG: hypothetical protein IJ261_04930 [Clostridia bacterium]|nr:hypothetical protein [Clostridia bacterium]